MGLSSLFFKCFLGGNKKALGVDTYDDVLFCSRHHCCHGWENRLAARMDCKSTKIEKSKNPPPPFFKTSTLLTHRNPPVPFLPCLPFQTRQDKTKQTLPTEYSNTLWSSSYIWREADSCPEGCERLNTYVIKPPWGLEISAEVLSIKYISLQFGAHTHTHTRQQGGGYHSNFAMFGMVYGMKING